MLLVMVLHASFKALGAPSYLEIIQDPIHSFLRCLSESVSAICVNVFILISGWFGIKAKMVRLSEFLFQVFFFGFLMYFVLLSLGLTSSMDLKGWAYLILLKTHWFVLAYIVLYIFSPVLNVFVSNCKEKELLHFLIAFFIIQTIYGLLIKSEWFSGGYSPLSFMGLYLLARYMRLYPNTLTQFAKCYDLITYMALSLLTAALSMSLIVVRSDGWLVYDYLSPLVILASVYFFLFFTKISIKSRFINWVAISSFAAYLVHCDGHFIDSIYVKMIQEWYKEKH